jgi:hypothetical protein
VEFVAVDSTAVEFVAVDSTAVEFVAVESTAVESVLGRLGITCAQLFAAQAKPNYREYRLTF